MIEERGHMARSESEFGKGTSFDWPQLLTTPRAALYTGCSKWAILRAVRSGQLTIAGRRGRVFVFRRADLEQWLTGANDDGAPLATITPLAAARRRSPISDSLARIRRAAGHVDGDGR